MTKLAPLMKPLRIVIVDDDEDNLVVLETALQSSGFVVLAARSREEARDLFASEERICDVLVTDYDLGDGTAFELLEELGAKRPEVAILVTGFGSADDRRASAAAGFRAHIVKPIAFDLLERTIHAAVAGADPPRA